MNKPKIEPIFPPITPDDIELDEKNGLETINSEFKAGFDFIKKYDRSVSFFGSSRFTEEDEHCKDAYELAKKIVKELDYAVVTGGGPGIMQAANHGAYDAKGRSLGLTINLPREQLSNHYLTDKVGFHYFFIRKTLLTFAAEAFVFYPGGFGTLDEFFGIATLVQTNKIPKVPLILVGRDFWEPLDHFIKKSMLETHHSIDAIDRDLYAISDSHSDIIDLIRKTPVLNWWKNYEQTNL